jgi:tetratricopeptide (TPR) repeat protein
MEYFFRKYMSRKVLSRSLIVLLFCTFSNASNAQPPLDSLLRKVHYQGEDSIKAKLYYDIGISYFYRDKATFRAYMDSVQRLSRKINYSKGIGLAYVASGNYYMTLNDWDKMKFNLQKSDSIFRKLGDQSKLMFSKGLYAHYYKLQGDYKKALQINLEILNYYEKNGPKTEEAKMLGAIAILLQQLERYKEAADYYRRSIRIRKEIKDYNGQSIALGNLGGMLAEQKQFAAAEPYLLEALRLQKDFQQEKVILTSQANLVHVYSETGRSGKALKLAKECEAFYLKMSDTLNSVKLSFYQSIAYMNLKQYDKALQVLKKKHRWIRNKPDYAELEADLLWQYYRVYKAMGKTDEALLYFEEAKQLEDHNSSMEVQHGISRMKEQYETEKKQRENLQLKQENLLKDLAIDRRNYFIYGGMLLLLLITVIAVTTIRYNRLKAGKVAVEMEQRLLQTQMNPHFIFNVLHAIHTYMLKKDTEESGKLLTSFARLVRSILQHSSTDNISLEEELKWLKDYMRLQQLRFNNSFDYKIEIDEQLSPDNLLLPPMLIQPFIENAIEHGFSGLDKPGELIISYRKSGKEVEIGIRDNGKGFSTDRPVNPNKEHESFAIQITEKRINLLNKRRKGAFAFVISSKPSEGTSILFSIPYRTLFD